MLTDPCRQSFFYDLEVVWRAMSSAPQIGINNSTQIREGVWYFELHSFKFRDRRIGRPELGRPNRCIVKVSSIPSSRLRAALGLRCISSRSNFSSACRASSGGFHSATTFTLDADAVFVRLGGNFRKGIASRRGKEIIQVSEITRSALELTIDLRFRRRPETHFMTYQSHFMTDPTSTVGSVIK